MYRECIGIFYYHNPFSYPVALYLLFPKTICCSDWYRSWSFSVAVQRIPSSQIFSKLRPQITEFKGIHKVSQMLARHSWLWKHPNVTFTCSSPTIKGWKVKLKKRIRFPPSWLATVFRWQRNFSVQYKCEILLYYVEISEIPSWFHGISMLSLGQTGISLLELQASIHTNNFIFIQ
jgi:hypothetical protein